MKNTSNTSKIKNFLLNGFALFNLSSFYLLNLIIKRRLQLLLVSITEPE